MFPGGLLTAARNHFPQADCACSHGDDSQSLTNRLHFDVCALLFQPPWFSAQNDTSAK